MPRTIKIAWAVGLSGVITLLIFFAAGIDLNRATLAFVIQAFGVLAFIRGYEDVRNGSTNQGEIALSRKTSPTAFWITVGIRSFVVGMLCLLAGLWIAIAA